MYGFMYFETVHISPCFFSIRVPVCALSSLNPLEMGCILPECGDLIKHQQGGAAGSGT